MKSALHEKKCVPCKGKEKSLPGKKARQLLRPLKNWKFESAQKKIVSVRRMKDFISAIKLIRQIAELAQREDHHPDLHLTRYRRLKIVLSTHAVNGLTENDFILASKIDRLN